MNPGAQDAPDAIETVYRRDARKVFATLVRLLGEVDLAEEALHDEFRAAIERWPVDGVPATPWHGWSRRAASRRSPRAARRR